MRDSAVDLFSISAHKFHGPKGVGALYIRDGVDLVPILIGGGQENGRRAGTEAVHQIAGIGTAAELVTDLMPYERHSRTCATGLKRHLAKSSRFARVNGTRRYRKRLPNTIKYLIREYSMAR